MAINTEQQNYDALVALKEAEPGLAALTSPSKTSVWGLWLRLWAAFLRALDLKLEAHKAEVRLLANAAVTQNGDWWKARLLEFQYGDQVVADRDIDGRVRALYPIVDETKKIIARASAVEAADGTVILKVAKLVGGALAVPSLDEQAAITAYVRQIKSWGIPLILVYKNPDKFRYYATVYYNALTPKTEVQANVEAAIAAYLADLPFDGSIDVQQLEAAVLAVTSVTTVATQSAQIKPEGAATYNPFNPRTRTLAGYVNIDPDFLLSATITYVDDATL